VWQKKKEEGREGGREGGRKGHLARCRLEREFDLIWLEGTRIHHTTGVISLD